MRLSPRIHRSRKSEGGYIMMMLLLTMALMVIAIGIIVPSVTFDIKRDREEEMIHRGVQYTRAVRAYYKKFGRYPVKIEDLENTNQMRFLRKRYKDPITGQDFRLLHFGEVKMSMNALMPNVPSGPTNGAPGFTMGNSLNSNSASAGASNSAFGSNPGFGSNSSFGSNSTAGSNSTFGQNSQTSSTTSSTQSGTDSSQNDAPPGTIVENSGSGDKLGGMTFGGMPIIGVASTSKNASIREFDHKKKYSQWAFVYDPTFDRGLLITTPYQPQLQMFGQGAPNLNGPNGSTQPSGFGVNIGNPSTGLQNNSNPPSNSGFGNNSPQNPPEQQ
jgi:type II secretory pathway pseudopilin PulG